MPEDSADGSPTSGPAAAMLSPKVQKAIEFCLLAHQGQERKAQPGVPYAVHPLQVGLVLSSFGHDDLTVVAGMLHDVVEDTDHDLADIEQRFGPEVAALVAEVSEDKALTWEQRKQHTIESIASMSDPARAVTAADKLHNLADIAWQEELQGDAIWSAFRRGKAATLNYYRSVSRELQTHFPGPLSTALARQLAHWDDSVPPETQA